MTNLQARAAAITAGKYRMAKNLPKESFKLHSDQAFAIKLSFIELFSGQDGFDENEWLQLIDEYVR